VIDHMTRRRRMATKRRRGDALHDVVL
jgi:hypothetical protein